MTTRHLPWRPVAALLSLLLTSAARAGSPVLEVKETTMCPWRSNEAAAQLITTQQEWDALSPFQPPAWPFAQRADWHAERVVIVTLGMRPNAGYGLTLMHAKPQRHTLTLSLHETTPAPDSLQAQVVTQPCVMLRLGIRGVQQIVFSDPAALRSAKLQVR